jgi:hypothetical protein
LDLCRHPKRGQIHAAKTAAETGEAHGVGLRAWPRKESDRANITPHFSLFPPPRPGDLTCMRVRGNRVAVANSVKSQTVLSNTLPPICKTRTGERRWRWIGFVDKTTGGLWGRPAGGLDLHIVSVNYESTSKAEATYIVHWFRGPRYGPILFSDPHMEAGAEWITVFWVVLVNGAGETKCES